VNVSELTLRFDDDGKFGGFSKAIDFIWLDKCLCERELLCVHIKGFIAFRGDILRDMELILSAVDFEEVKVRIVKKRLLRLIVVNDWIFCHFLLFCHTFLFQLTFNIVYFWQFFYQISFGFILF